MTDEKGNAYYLKCQNKVYALDLSFSHKRINCSMVLLIRIKSFQFLQEDVAVGDRIVLVRHNEKLEDGPSA